MPIRLLVCPRGLSRDKLNPRRLSGGPLCSVFQRGKQVIRTQSWDCSPAHCHPEARRMQAVKQGWGLGRGGALSQRHHTGRPEQWACSGRRLGFLSLGWGAGEARFLRRRLTVKHATNIFGNSYAGTHLKCFRGITAGTLLLRFYR